MTHQIRALRTDDRDEVQEWIDVCMRAVRVTRPGHASRGLDATMAELAKPQPGFEGHHLVGLEDGRIVSLGDWWLFSGAEADKAMVAVYVDPDARGLGHGRRMADAVESRIERPVLLAEVDLPSAGDDFTARPAEERQELLVGRDARFAAARGYRAGALTIARELRWPPDASQLQRLAPETPGYRVRTWVDGLPDELVPGYGVLAGLVDADAPSGEIEWHGEPLTPEEYRIELAREVGGGGHRVETLALVEGPDGDAGEPVAFTSVYVPGNPERFLSVGATYVHREHRGHRLGMAVKVAIEQRLLAMDLPHPSLRTGNADDNRWMVAINEALGFVPVLRTAELVKRRG